MNTAESFFLFLNKPRGLTSQSCLTQFKKRFGFKKIGHHGTLDPFATGLLLVGVNEATKFFRFVDDSSKTYVATLKLGEATDTLDGTGRVIDSQPLPELTLADIQTISKNFTGTRTHTPPMFSAVKVNGKKLYELARQGQEVEREAREVVVSDFTVLDWQAPHVVLSVTVSRGTYVRVLADEFARALGTLGHLVQLERTRLCGRSIENAVSLDDDEEKIAQKKIGMGEMLNHLPSIELDEAQAREVFFGRKCSSVQVFTCSGEEVVKKKNEDFVVAFFENKFVGILEREGSILKPIRLVSSVGADLCVCPQM